MYSRELDTATLTLGASGWTYRNTFVLYDYQTESLWYHLEGEDGLTCIAGQFADRILEEFVSYQMRWNEWISQHPESKVLKYP